MSDILHEVYAYTYMSVWTPVMDHMLFVNWHNIYDPFKVPVHKEHIGQTLYWARHLLLAIQVPTPSLWHLVNVHVYRLSGHYSTHNVQILQ